MTILPKTDTEMRLENANWLELCLACTPAKYNPIQIHTNNSKEDTAKYPCT